MVKEELTSYDLIENMTSEHAQQHIYCILVHWRIEWRIGCKLLKDHLSLGILILSCDVFGIGLITKGINFQLNYYCTLYNLKYLGIFHRE